MLPLPKLVTRLGSRELKVSILSFDNPRDEDFILRENYYYNNSMSTQKSVKFKMWITFLSKMIHNININCSFKHIECGWGILFPMGNEGEALSILWVCDCPSPPTLYER